MQVQWWCAAQGIPWSWEWRAYPGVWAAVILLFAAYQFALKRTHSAPRTRAQLVAGYIGVVLTWLALDWPLGALGAGYLASFHALKFLILAFIVPPLLWTPFANLRPASTLPATRPLSGPLLSAIFFNVVLVFTHTPVVVNSFAESQAGSFVIDAAWFAAGLALWRPVIVSGIILDPLVKMLYVFGGTLGHSFLGMYLILSKLPSYTVFELAPRVHDISARMDQGLAGAAMILIGTPLVFVMEIYLFSQWFRQHNGTPQKSEPPALE